VAYISRYHYTPYAAEQGISKRVSGNFFRGTGNFNQRAAKRRKAEHVQRMFGDNIIPEQGHANFS
jgi:hypothetical protein